MPTTLWYPFIMSTQHLSQDPLFRPIRLERVSEKVATQLRDVIGKGIFRAGDRLPAERELAEQMGVSRPSVREAIQILSAQGILETVHGGGSIVKNFTDQEIRKPIEIFLEDDKTRVLELAEVRALMEAWAARKAAENRSPRELERIRSHLTEMEKDFTEGQIRFEVDFRFHTEIAAATHNTIFLHLIDTIYQLIQYSIKVYREQVFVGRGDQQKILEHHRGIFQAIEKGDPDLAELAMSTHLLFVLAEYKKWASS